MKKFDKKIENNSAQKFEKKMSKKIRQFYLLDKIRN